MKKSLHFGLNSVMPEFFSGWSGFLQGCCADARDTAAVCARAGFTTRAVFDHDCTIARLRNEFAEAASELRDGDVFFWSDSGHGGQKPALVWSGYSESVVLADGELADTAQRELVSAFKPGVRVIICLDICHAGGGLRASPAVRAKPAWVKPSVVSMPTRGGIPIAASAMLMAGSSADELSMDGQFNGVFTGALLAIADDFEARGETLTYENWMNATKRLLSQNGASQHPMAVFEGEPADWNVDVTNP